MKLIETQIIQEADNLSKETGVPFRDCLEMLWKGGASNPINTIGRSSQCNEDLERVKGLSCKGVINARKSRDHVTSRNGSSRV